jgi:uncharacterized protein YdhG (YjbR/CyaY superfamily)
MRSFGMAREVDGYIARAPRTAREKLLQLRSVFREVAPQAREVISYHMPYYKLNGPLGGFAAYKDHVTLFGALPEGLREELRPYKTGRGSVQFPLDEPLPVELVAKLVRAHVEANEARSEPS